MLILSIGIPLVVVLLVLALSLRIVMQYERGMLFHLGRVIGVRSAGLTFITRASPFGGARACRPR